MKACKITIEILACDREMADILLKRMVFASSKSTSFSIGDIDGSANMEVSEVELPDIDDGENL